MPDRYDPKVSVRPLSERRSASASTEDDPLVELARLVTGRSPFDPAASGRNKAAPAVANSHVPDPSHDLESELLSDLQASFAAIRDQVAPASPPPTPAAQKQAQPAAPRPAAPSSIRTAPPRPAPAPAMPDAGLEGDEAPPLRPAANARQDDRPGRPEAAPGVRPAARAPSPQAKQSEPPSFFRPSRGAAPGRADTGDMSLRPTTAPAAPPRAAAAEPSVRPPSSRWARPEPSRAAPPSAEASRIAPPRAPTPVRQAPTREPEFDAYEEEALYDEGAAYLEEPAPFDQDAVYEDDLALRDLDMAAYGPDDELPPFPDDELADLGRRRSRRTFALIGVVLGVVIVGGGAFYVLQGGAAGNSPPPIIAADATPTKVAPAETTTADTDQQGKLIYDRVDEGSAGADTVLVTPGEDPIADIPPIPEEDAGNPISRVIIPGGPGIDGPIADDGAAAADGETPSPESGVGDTDAAVTPIGPRKVRTVVVRPDGTIVSSEATPAGDTAGGADAATASSGDDMEIPPARTEMDAVLEGDSVAVNPDPLTAGGTGSAPAGTVPAGDDGSTAAADTAAAPAEDFPDPAAAPAAPAPAPPKPTIVATTGTASGPIDLTPASPSRPVAAVSSSGFLVQVSSQRSEEAARSTFRDLQAKYPSVLGSYQADIQRADLGDRGIYFRVRVGPFSSNDAQRLCQNLKAAGGDCIIAR